MHGHRLQLVGQRAGDGGLAVGHDAEADPVGAVNGVEDLVGLDGIALDNLWAQASGTNLS